MIQSGAVARPVDHALEAQMRRAFAGPAFIRPSQIPYADDLPFDEAKRRLGHTLFFDQRLSRAGNQSCASCHHAGLGWEMGIPKALGAAEMPRKSQTLLNLAWSDTWFWDGRADSFEQQFRVALRSPKALAMTEDELVQRLNKIPGYAPMFKTAFADQPIDVTTVAKALEVYQRGLVAGPAPFDAWVKGDARALSSEAKRGALLFAGKAGCVACHSGWNFTDNGFHDVGMPDADLGRGKIVDLPALQHAFKTPTLRNIERRRPYMHDGSLADLDAVVRHYANGGAAKRPSLAPEVKPFALTEAELADLVAFLKSLTGIDAAVTIPQMPM